MLLEARAMVAGYGELNILNGCEIFVEEGRISVIVGANGAGKSTAMKAIFGMLPLRQGTVKYQGKNITGYSPESLVAAGIGFVPQTNNVFPAMSVQENLEMGAYLRNDDINVPMAKVFELFPILREKANQPAGELSGGQRQMLAVGRAMMMEPRLLMLDEPTAGLSPRAMGDIFEMILRVNEIGVGVLMVEQNARQALQIADTGFVLSGGHNLFIDSGEALLADPQVARSFLGGN